MNPSPLAGLRVLLVEDEPVIALGLQSALEQAGAEVVSLAHTVAQAMTLMDRSSFDVAVLDFRLEKETSTLVAVRLTQLNVPYLFHTLQASRLLYTLEFRSWISQHGQSSSFLPLQPWQRSAKGTGTGPIACLWRFFDGAQRRYDTDS